MFHFSALYHQAAAHLKAVDGEYIRTVDQATDLVTYHASSAALEQRLFGGGRA